MAIKDIFKVSRKTFVDPRAWLGYDAVKDQTVTIWSLVKTLFFPPVLTAAPHPETFEETMQRLNVTEDNLTEAVNNFRFLSILFIILAIFACMGSIYLLLEHSTFAGFMLALSGAPLFLSQAFKYDFWAFQIKQRKLGCTFTEWRNRKINNKQGPGR